MSRLSDMAGENHKNIRKLGLIDPENSTIVNDSQTSAINAYMIIANICFTIAAIYVVAKCNNILTAALIVVGVCCANMAAKIIANAVQKHDMMITLAAKLRSNYEEEKKDIIKEQTNIMKNFGNYKKPIYNNSQLKKLKEEVHKTALERIEDNIKNA